MREVSDADQAHPAFRVLGPLEVRAGGGATVVIRQRLHRRVLGVLLLRAGELCPRSWLLTALWGEHLPASGADALRTAVGGLRRELGGLGRYVQTRQAGPVPGGYLIQPEADDADILAFRARAAAGRSAWYGGNITLASSLLGAALRLWRGELPDLPASTPVTALATRLRAELREAQDLAVDARLALGEYQAVIPLLRERTAQDPVREHAWAQLVSALHGSGDRQGALSASAAAHAAISAGYGSGPGPELALVHRQVLAGGGNLA